MTEFRKVLGQFDLHKLALLEREEKENHQPNFTLSSCLETEGNQPPMDDISISPLQLQ